MDKKTRDAEHPNVRHADAITPTTHAHGDTYEATRWALARATGGQQLGCSLYEIPPGKRAWPRHAHLANEEALFILSGTGTLELGDTQTPVRAGTYATLLAGPQHAHRLTNTGDAPLRYLCVSTMREPDVTLYPDTARFGVFAGAAPGGDPGARTITGYFPLSAGVGYWDDEG